MRFCLPQDLLDEGLRTVARAVATRGGMPLLAGIHLRAGDQAILLRSTDLEIALARRLPADVLQEGEMVLPGRCAMELVRRLPAGVVEVTGDPVNCTARIAGGDCEYALHGSPGEQFPGEPPVENADAAFLSGGSLRRLLRDVSFAVGRDDSRPIPSGVALSVSGERATAMATDGSILAYAEAAVANPAGLVFRAILPGRTVRELEALLAERGAEACETIPLERQLLFRLGEVSLLTRLLDGAYPDFLRLLPDAYGSNLALDRSRLVAACDRASLLAEKGAVLLTAAEDGLHLLARTPSVGSVAQRVPGELRGATFSVPLNVEYLLAGLRAGNSPRVVVEYAGGRTAVRFQPDPATGSFFAVLPLVSF